MKLSTARWFSVLALLLLFAALQTKAAGTVYYLENNATNQSVGADGVTNFSVSETKIAVPPPYKNLMKNGTMGAKTNISVDVIKDVTIEFFRFYLPANYSVNTLISANATYTIRWRDGVGSQVDTINISLLAYNPATGATTFMGNATTITPGNLNFFANYSNTISNPQYVVPAGSRLMVRINTTPSKNGDSALWFNDSSSYINITGTPLAPNITSWSNNFTNDSTLLFDVPLYTSVRFNVTANQTVRYNWTYDGADQGQNYDNFTEQFTAIGLHYINATVDNLLNGTDFKNWTVSVIPETIDVTLSNVPVDFGDITSGSSNQSAFLPLNVTIHSTTNVDVNLTLNGSDFTSGAYSFGAGNLSYSNSSTGTRTAAATYFPLPPYSDWVNIKKQTTANRSIYFWISIPPGQGAGLYNSQMNVRVERYI